MDLKNDGMMILHTVLKPKKQGVYKCYEGVKVFKDVEESHATCAIHTVAYLWQEEPHTALEISGQLYSCLLTVCSA